MIKFNSVVCWLERYAVMMVWTLSILFMSVQACAQAAGVIRLEDRLSWSPLTLTMCVVGWFLSWSSDWLGVWNKERQCLTKYVVSHLPRVLTGFVTMLVCYALLPELGSVLGFEVKLNNFGAFVVGLASDVLIARVRAVIPQRAKAPPPEAGGP